MKTLIAPSILSANFGQLDREIQKVEEAGADMIHVDVMDGQFVPNITIGPPVVAAIRKSTSLPLDVHLMIVNPDRYLEDFIKAGADILTVHVEACTHLHRTLSAIKEKGVKAGVALNPATPVSTIEHILDLVDLILIMTVNPGFGGQKFIDATLPKIERVSHSVDTLKVYLEVDGGITLDNIQKVKHLGANVIVAGSSIYQAQDIKETISRMKSDNK